MKTRNAATRSNRMPVALTIAGSDSGAGAGAQVDLLTFAAHRVFGTSVLTCLTAQNPRGVTGVHEVPAEFVAEQLERVHEYFRIRALKTGMLFSAPIIHTVSRFLSANPRLRAVVDPVMVATSGAVLLQPDAIEAIKAALIPRAAIVTPNLDEAGVLFGSKPSTADETIEVAHALATTFGVPFLVKGGHLPGDRLVDVLARPRGRPRVWRSARIHGVDTHGSGCTLSAAIAALLARGEPLDDAVAGARAFLRRGLSHPLVVGRDRFIAHR